MHLGGGSGVGCRVFSLKSIYKKTFFFVFLFFFTIFLIFKKFRKNPTPLHLYTFFILSFKKLKNKE